MGGWPVWVSRRAAGFRTGFAVESRTRDFENFPEDARVTMFDALTLAAEGALPRKAKPFRGVESGLFEIASWHRGDAFRTSHVVRIDAGPWVIHAFQQKSKSGVIYPIACGTCGFHVEAEWMGGPSVPLGSRATRQLAAHGACGLNFPMKWNLSVIRLAISSRQPSRRAENPSTAAWNLANAGKYSL